jgi:hypothetical protein
VANKGATGFVLRKTATVAVLLTLTLAGTAAPLASAVEPDLLLMVHVTPPEPNRGDLIEIHVAALKGPNHVSLDGITGTASLYDGETSQLEFEENGTGTYVAVLTLPLAVREIRLVAIGAEGTLGLETATQSVLVRVADMPPFVDEGLMLLAIWENERDLGSWLRPGDTIRYRVWTYLDGTLETGIVPNGSGYLWPYDGRASHFSREAISVGPGEFEFSYIIPEDLQVSARVYIRATVEDPVPVVGSAHQVWVHPVPAVLVVEHLEAGGAAVRACAGNEDSPLEGADVRIGIGVTNGSGLHESDHSLRTEANGCVRVLVDSLAVDYGQVQAHAEIVVGGKTTILDARSIVEPRNSYVGGPKETPDGFTVDAETDPSSLSAGKSGFLVFGVRLDGEPFADGEVGVVAFRSPYAGAPGLVGNYSTDANGQLTLSYRVPSDWSDDDYLNVHLYTPAGHVIPFYFAFEPNPQVSHGIAWEPLLEIDGEEDRENGTLRLRADYRGPSDLTGWFAYVELFPVSAGIHPWDAVAGNFPSALWEIDGSSITGELELPPWLWEDDYRVRITAYRLGRAVGPDPNIAFWNSSVVHLRALPVSPVPAEPEPEAPPAPEGTDGPSIQADGLPFLALLLLVVAGTALGAWFLHRRRTREG